MQETYKEKGWVGWETELQWMSCLRGTKFVAVIASACRWQRVRIKLTGGKIWWRRVAIVLTPATRGKVDWHKRAKSHNALEWHHPFCYNVVSQCRCEVLTGSEDQDRLLLGLNLLGLINLEAQLPGTIEFYQKLI